MKVLSISRVKHLLPLIFFAFLLLFLCNKAFQKSSEPISDKTLTSLIHQQALANTKKADVLRLSLLTAVAFVLLAVLNLYFFIRTENENALHVLLKRNALLKPPAPCRFYYRLFSLRFEDPFVLG